MACFMTPFGLAFEWLDSTDEVDTLFYFGDTWSSVESIIDIVFIIEIIVCFNTSVYESKTNEFVTSMCIIA